MMTENLTDGDTSRKPNRSYTTRSNPTRPKHVQWKTRKPAVNSMEANWDAEYTKRLHKSIFAEESKDDLVLNGKCSYNVDLSLAHRTPSLVKSDPGQTTKTQNRINCEVSTSMANLTKPVRRRKAANVLQKKTDGQVKWVRRAPQKTLTAEQKPKSKVNWGKGTADVTVKPTKCIEVQTNGVKLDKIDQRTRNKIKNLEMCYNLS